MSGAYHYAVRQHVFEKERRWTADATGLTWQAEDRNGHFDFSEIVDIRLEWAATRFDPGSYQCRVTRFNGWTETIVSRHFAGPASFEDRGDSYGPFVLGLVALAAAANPRCRFSAGAAPLKFWGNAAILLLAVLLLGAVLLLVGLPPAGLIAVKLAVIAVFAPRAYDWMKRNRPRRFQPPAIPADVLPAP